MAARMKTAISQSRQRTPPIGRLRRLVCGNGFRSNTFAGIALRGNSALQEDVKVKMDQVIEAYSAPAQQVLNKGSKTRTQTRRIRATHQSECLKSVFLDAIAHDFKTPLTLIKASVTGLLDDLETDREQRKELLTIIDEECDRIDRLVSEASEIARLESGAVKLDLASHSVEELISAALADCRSATSNRRICLDVKHPNTRLRVDLSLAKRILVHLITNET